MLSYKFVLYLALGDNPALPERLVQGLGIIVEIFGNKYCMAGKLKLITNYFSHIN